MNDGAFDVREAVAIATSGDDAVAKNRETSRCGTFWRGEET